MAALSADLPASARILAAIRAVPRGSVAGYGHIARRAGLPGRARMVARLLAGNEDPLLPWHRIVRSDGRIAFPPGSPGFEEQAQRLRAECAAEELECPHVRAQPVGKRLREGRFRVGVVRAAEHSNEDLRLADLTGAAVDHADGMACVIDEALLSSTMFKAQQRLGCVRKRSEVIAERAVLQSVGVLRLVLLPQQQARDARASELTLQVREVGQWDVR